MADDSLYIAEDGEIMAFATEFESRYVETCHLPAPAGEPEWVYDEEGLPRIHPSKQRWTRLACTDEAAREAGVRRLIAERDEARALLLRFDDLRLESETLQRIRLSLDVRQALRLWGLL